jgi:GT2 family glycosyltransferase
MHITVCIPTRDRGSGIAATLQSLACSHYEDFDVVIVDQSADDATERAVHNATGMVAGLTYVRTASTGASRARNIGIMQARGPLIAFTDDDCEVSPSWLGTLVSLFAAHPRVGLICGEVQAGPHDPAQGFVPDFHVSQPTIVSSPWMKWRCRGISANMAMRLDVVRASGMFDESLGPGSAFFLAEDYDLTYRVLRAGFAVLSSPDAVVIHHGFRAWPEARVLMRRSGFGSSAAYMKHLRVGDVAMTPTFLYGSVEAISWRKLMRLKRGSGLAYVLWYFRGALASFRIPIDRKRRLFISNPHTVAQVEAALRRVTR